MLERSGTCGGTSLWEMVVSKACVILNSGTNRMCNLGKDELASWGSVSVAEGSVFRCVIANF